MRSFLHSKRVVLLCLALICLQQVELQYFVQHTIYQKEIGRFAPSNPGGATFYGMLSTTLWGFAIPLAKSQWKLAEFPESSLADPTPQSVLWD